MRRFIFAALVGAILISTASAEIIGFDNLYMTQTPQVQEDATEEAKDFFVAEVLPDREAVHYQTPAMDVYIYEDHVKFNGKRYEWKKDDRFIGIFMNLSDTTEGSYGRGKKPFISVVNSDNTISLVSINKKYAVEFHESFIRVNEKNRNWMLIIPFPSSEETNFIDLDSMKALEENIPGILDNLVEGRLNTLDFHKVLMSRMKPDPNITIAIEKGTFAFDEALEQAIKKKKRLYETKERDRVIFSFYLACKDSLDFEQVKEVKKQIYTTAMRDFVIFNWAVEQTLTIDQLIDVKKQMYNTENRDGIIMHYIAEHKDSLTNEELKTLRKQCYQTENRDKIALMITD